MVELGLGFVIILVRFSSPSLQIIQGLNQNIFFSILGICMPEEFISALLSYSQSSADPAFVPQWERFFFHSFCSSLSCKRCLMCNARPRVPGDLLSCPALRFQQALAMDLCLSQGIAQFSHLGPSFFMNTVRKPIEKMGITQRF